MKTFKIVNNPKIICKLFDMGEKPYPLNGTSINKRYYLEDNMIKLEPYLYLNTDKCLIAEFLPEGTNKIKTTILFQDPAIPKDDGTIIFENDEVFMMSTGAPELNMNFRKEKNKIALWIHGIVEKENYKTHETQLINSVKRDEVIYTLNKAVNEFNDVGLYQ